MKQELKARLSVNTKEIEMNQFVESLVAQVVFGIVSTLKGVDYIKTIFVDIDKGQVTIKVNNEEIALTPFPNDIIASTLTGMVSPLKGADKVDTLEITVDVK